MYHIMHLEPCLNYLVGFLSLIGSLIFLVSRSDDGVVSTTVDIASYGRAIKALFHFISFHIDNSVTAISSVTVIPNM